MDLEQVCRTCLRPGEALLSLFESKVTIFETETISIVEILKIFTKIMIATDDKLPDKICSNCLHEIQRAYSFKLKCEESDATLKKLIKLKNEVTVYDILSKNSIDNIGTLNNRVDETQGPSKVVTKSEKIFIAYERECNDDSQLARSASNGIKIKQEPELDLTDEEYFEPEIILEDIASAEIFECPNCSYESIRLETLEKHILDNHTKEDLSELTPKEFPSNNITHNSRNPFEPEYKRKPIFQCLVCLKCCPSKCRYDEHMRMHTGIRPYKCNICPEAFRYKFGLKNHERTKHGILESNEKHELQCSICSKIFGHKSGLVAHMRIHTGDLPFKCELCSKAFRYKSNLRSHNKINHSSKQNDHTCEICMRVFTCTSKLIYHSRSHTKEKPFKCEICSKTFRYTNNLNVHMREKHNHEDPNVNNLNCEICSKTLTCKSKLEYHMRSHFDEKHFKCEVCSKTFRHKQNLSTHMLLNSGYKCGLKS